MRLRRPRPDVGVRRLLMQVALVRAPQASTTSVARVRRDWQLAVKAFASRLPVASVSELDIPGPGGSIRLRVYTPHGATQPNSALVWLHGGGFVFGDMYTAGATSRALANYSGATVVSVRYRLAPEHPLHDGLEDCLTALRWVADHAEDLGVDAYRLAVGGDSAGGGMAALVAQHARSGPRLAAQVLVYPATDLTGSYPSQSEDMPGMLDQAWTHWIRTMIAEVSDLADPTLSAIRTEDLAGVAPAIVLTAGFDPLRDEGIHYAERMRDQGVPVRLLHFPGQIHGFLTLDRVLTGGRYGLRRLGAELALAFTQGVAPGVDDELPWTPDLDHLLWLHPGQRWHELKVGAVVVRERALRARSARRDRSLGASPSGSSHR